MNIQVGVIGGGQLAWMMAAEAPKLGIELIVQTPNQDDPAVKRAHDIVFADIDDVAGTAKLAQYSDFVTFENEFVDLEALRKVKKDRGSVCFCPSLATLKPLLDKYDQRNYLQSINVRVPKFGLYPTPELAADYGFPVVLKARRHGYDGQGTFMVRNAQDLEQLAKTVPVKELLVEEFIPFERELGIIAARNSTGEIAIYPVTETNQENQVCTWTITPADVSEEVEETVKAIARTILEALQVVGVFGIEFFLTKDNQVLVNEIAPRTHNSGHYTLDGCETSQFAMQLQAVTGMPLGSTALKSAGALMVNLLGFEESASDYQKQRDCEASRRHRILTIPNSFVHWYGKTSRPGRKLGHVTVVLDQKDLTQAKSIIEQIEAFWYKNQDIGKRL